MSAKLFSILLLLLFVWGFSYGQTYTEPHPIREADVMWQKRIWRVIDLREKMNLKLYYPLQAKVDSSSVLTPSVARPRISLFQVIKNALASGDMAAYEFNPVDLDDCFRVRLTKTEVEQTLSSIDTIQDENGNMVPVRNEVEPSSITGYTLKEDWIFEKQRSMLETRILAMCPRAITINKNTGKEDENAAPTSLFWIYYPAFGPLFSKIPIFNDKNNAAPRSLYSIFSKRQFSSYIIQESNVYDRAMSAYVKGLDALLEGEKVHDKIAALEHDMWQY
jgi:gliding motility associated protien GldN